MNASFYDLLKYANTGIASPEMTYFDKMRALSMAGGGKIKTLTGIPPLSFTGNGKPLISLSMLGNGQQTGTPSPDNIIMPDFCGVRTGNLFDFEQLKNAPSGTIGSTTFPHVLTLQLKANTYYTMASNGTGSTSSTPADLYRSIYFNATTGESSINKNNPVTLLTDSTGVVGIGFFSERKNAQQYLNGEAQLWINEGSTALPYEPYGYKIPITCAGQTVPVYLGQTPTVRKIKKLVLTGEETDGRISSTGRYLTRLTNQLKGIAPICTHYRGSDTTYYAGLQDGHVSVSIQTFLVIYNSRCTTIDDYREFFSSQYTAGTPVTVWYVLAEPETAIVNEPLCKIGDYADELHSTDAGVSIPTANGDNTLTVGTELQPSSMTITGHIE